MSTNQGSIVQCIGAVVDIEFPRNAMPYIYDALTLDASATHAGVEAGLYAELAARVPAAERAARHVVGAGAPHLGVRGGHRSLDRGARGAGHRDGGARGGHHCPGDTAAGEGS